MLISHTQVFGFEAAIRGARHSRKSNHKSDSSFTNNHWFQPTRDPNNHIKVYEGPIIGPNDLKLMKSLVLSGDEHGKFTRFIMVWVDFTLPIDVWSELDTYHVGPISRLSESTMYQLGRRDLTFDDFEKGDVSPDVLSDINSLALEYRRVRLIKDHIASEQILDRLNKRLPRGYLLTSTMIFNYQNLRNIYYQRRNHQKMEWNTKERNTKYSICKWIEDLPYAQELICLESKKKD